MYIFQKNDMMEINRDSEVLCKKRCVAPRTSRNKFRPLSKCLKMRIWKNSCYIFLRATLIRREPLRKVGLIGAMTKELLQGKMLCLVGGGFGGRKKESL